MHASKTVRVLAVTLITLALCIGTLAPTEQAHAVLGDCLAYDTFSRADGVLGNTEATGPSSEECQILTWAGSTFLISSNKAVNSPSLTDELLTDGGMENW